MGVNTLRTAVLIVVALVLIAGLAAWNQDPPDGAEPRSVSVTGEAEVRVVPDEVVLTLGVETWDQDMDTAKGENDRIVAGLLALAGDLGIPPEHVQTDYVSIEPRYKDGYYEQRDFVGYFVRKSVVITLRDLSQFEALLTGALDAGANYVQGIEFRTTELRRHRDEARALAVQAAREKAEALAGELGQTVGQPLAIEEVQSDWWSGYGAWWGGRWGGTMTQNVIQELGGGAFSGDTTVAPGQINVNARVQVHFALD